MGRWRLERRSPKERDLLESESSSSETLEVMWIMGLSGTGRVGAGLDLGGRAERGAGAYTARENIRPRYEIDRIDLVLP
jgi:hypothetical protein